MFCENCGAKIPDGALFCENCGKPVSPEAIAAQTAQSQTPSNPNVDAQGRPLYDDQGRQLYYPDPNKYRRYSVKGSRWF